MEPDSPVPLRPAAVRELAGALLVLLGAVNVLVAAFAWDWRAGVALIGAGCLTVGVRLIMGEV